MDDDGFEYILSPAVSTRDCVQHILKENLPSLEEAVEYAEGRKGFLLIDCDIFFNDALRSFSQVTDKSLYTNKTKGSFFGGAFLPAMVTPAGNTSSASAPELFEDRPWSQVWTQFERDISRESLVIDGILCDDALTALQRIQTLLTDAYNGLPSHFVGGTTRRLTEFFGNGKFAWPILTAAKVALRPLDAVYCEMVKSRKLTEAVRLAILTAQQTVLALPVELLQAQFSRPSKDECGEFNSGLEPRMIYIGESHANNVNSAESSALLSNDDRQKMIVRIERRKEGDRVPFVRVEKTLSAFTVDESANRTTHLLLWIDIEVNLFTKGHVELKWEWRRP